MRLEAHWQPSKFQLVDGVLIGSLNPCELGIGSRLMGQLQATAYQRTIEKYARGHLADLGCGTAPLYAVYRPKVTTITCIDWPGSLHFKKHVDIEADLNAGIPLKDNTIDTVLCTDVLEHIKEPFLFWRELRRILAPSGVVILAVPFMYWLHEEPHDYFRYTRHRLAAFCEESGMNMLELTEYGGPVAVLLDLIGKNMGRSKTVYMAVAKWFYYTRLGQKLDLANRRVFPLGYVLVAGKN